MDEHQMYLAQGLTKLQYTIGEVAEMYRVTVSTIRHWEGAFPQLRPRTSKGGTRQYTKKEIEQIGVVYHLIKERGLTIKGARAALSTKADAVKRRAEVLQKLHAIKGDLQALRNALDKWERQSLVAEVMQTGERVRDQEL